MSGPILKQLSDEQINMLHLKMKDDRAMLCSIRARLDELQGQAQEYADRLYMEFKSYRDHFVCRRDLALIQYEIAELRLQYYDISAKRLKAEGVPE